MTATEDKVLTFFNLPEEIEAYNEGRPDDDQTLPLEDQVLEEIQVSKLVIPRFDEKMPIGRLFYKFYQFDSTVINTELNSIFRTFENYTIVLLNGKTRITRNYEGILDDLMSLNLEPSDLIKLEDHLETREDLKKKGIMILVPKELKKPGCEGKLDHWIKIHQD